MELSISSYSYSRAMSDSFTIADAIKHAKSVGFDGMEFSGTSFMNYSEFDSMKVLKDLCGEAELKIYNLAAGVNFVDNYDDAIVNGKKLIDLACTLGSPSVRCDTMGGLAKAGNGGIRYVIPKIAKGVAEVADYAAEKNINLLVENHGWVMQDSIIVEELINTVNRPNYGALVDIGNFLCADENPIEGVGRLARYVKHVHLKDFHIKSGNEFFLPTGGWFGTRGGNRLRGAMLGHGNVPVYQCVKILKNVGYNGAISLEFEGVEPALYAIEMSVGSMKNLLKLLD